MIIAHNISAINTYNKMGVSGKATDRSMEKLSSGYRINRAADDAAGLSISEKMRSQIRGLNQASSNAQNGISMIQTAEGALNEAHSICQRMRELAVQAANDTNAATDRAALQSEIDQLTSEINRIGNTTEFNGMKLLNGSKTRISGLEEIEVAKPKDNITIAKGTNGAKNSAGLILAETIKLAGTDEVDKTKLQSKEGVNIIQIGKKDGKLIANIKLTEAKGTTDPDITEASNNSLTINAEELIQDKEGNWTYDNHGITFKVTRDSATKFLVEGADSDVASIDLYQAKGSDSTHVINATDAGGFDIINEYEDDSSYKGSISAINLSDYEGAVRRLDYDRAEILFENNNPKATLTVKYFNGSDNIVSDVMTFASVDATTAAVANIKEYDANGLQFKLSADEGFGFGEKIHAILDFDSRNGIKTVAGNKLASDNSVYFHVGANTNQVINTTFGDMRAHALGLTGIGEAYTLNYTVNNGSESQPTEKGLNISTRAGANYAIDVIDKAVEIISQERSKYGAIQNRLEYTINNVDTTAENMTNAESTIRDTDMANEMMEMTKTQILQQASQAMLSQAMQRPQQVLQLLQG